MKRLLALIGFFAIAPLHAETIAINQFSGLNTDDPTLSLTNGQTPDSENVITDDGPGLQGRKGFILYSTQSPTGMWEFPKSDGTRYIIENTGTQLRADTGAGTFSTIISTVPSDRVVAGSVLGDRFYFADTLNGLKYWDGTTVAVASATMKVDKLVTWKGRLAAAGITSAQRAIYLSKYLDGTSWTAPTNPSDDDAALITVTGALDENIQALFSSYKDLLVWFKKNSFGAIYGSRRSNFSQRTFSDYVGVASPETIRDCDGYLRWLGNNRKMWEFDGATFKKISEDDDILFSAIAQGDSTTRSNTQSSQADFSAGTQSPTTFGDLSTSPGNLTPRTTTFIDTASSDWGAGASVPSAWMTGTTSLQLATTVGVDVGDNLQAEFAAGTLTNTDATTTSGSLGLTLGAETTLNSEAYGASTLGGRIVCGTIELNQSFTAAANYIATTVRLVLSKDGTTTGTYTLALRSNSGALSPGSTLASATLNAATVGAAAADYDLTLSPSVALNSGTRYWLTLTGTGCNGSNTLNWYRAAGLTEYYFETGGTPAQTVRAIHLVRGRQYSSSGNIVSRTFDIGITTNTWLWTWGVFTANSTLPSSTSITYETQTSADGSNWDSLQSVLSGNNPASTVRRYIRYKASLATTNLASTPLLNDATLTTSSMIRPAATFTSRAFDTAIVAPAWGNFVSSPTFFGAGGAYSFFTQSSADGSTWDAAVAASSGTHIGSNRKRYLRYIYSSTATSPAIYNRLEDVTVTAKSTGTFTTQAVSIGNNISAWGPVGASVSDGGGGFTIQFSTSTDGVTFSSWTTIVNNSIPTVSTAPYAATRFLFDLDVATDTPTLSDVTINWVEGSTLRAASAYFNQRYWLAVAISGASSNNRVFVYDKKRQWQRYNGINIAATTIYNSKFYFGNTSGIFEAENGYTDNGTVITAYYTTPTLVPNKLDLYSNFDYLYMTSDSSDSTLTSTYQINGSTTNYSLGSMQMNATNGFQNFKLPFSASEVQTGKNISFKWSVSGSSFWRINNGTLYHQPLALPE